VKTIDDVQGEEYDIVLLSVVRSRTEVQDSFSKKNAGKRIGFIGKEDRIIVALSRAKQGMVVFGNREHLCSYSREWQRVFEQLDEEDIVKEIPFSVVSHSCKDRPEMNFVACTGRDFQKFSPDGGCRNPCYGKLNCGHACVLSCHPFSHEQVICRKNCGRRIPGCNHQCRRLCCECYDEPSNECKPCLEPLQKHLECGHVANMQCSMRTEDFLCRVEIQKELPCHHEVEVTCGGSSEEIECPFLCPKKLPCGHSCRGKCGDCKEGIHQLCTNQCERILPCGHKCADGSGCSKQCPPCSEPCEQICDHSRFEFECGKPCVPCQERCKWACHINCSKKKQCKMRCSELCDRDECDERCPKQLDCGHRCSGLCGEDCSTPCRTCSPETLVWDESFMEEKLKVPILELKCCQKFVTLSKQWTFM